ncbi:gliding motility lipoprotein GldD [soil metagenome]
MYFIRPLLSICIFSLFISCNSEETSVPKPRGYYRIALPKHDYKMFAPESCPFTFEIPTYATALPDTNGLSQACWYYLILPRFNGQIYLTYKKLENDLPQLLDNTRTLVYKHTARASSIDENVFHYADGVSGVIYDIGGDAASPLQFFATDSTHHFLRGAVYFNSLPNADSIAPVEAYLRADIEHLLQSLKWK